MLQWIDQKINGLTMYRLTLRGLMVISGVAIVEGFLGLIDYSGWSLLLSFFVLVFFCDLFSRLLSKIFHSQPSVESSWITGMILFLILMPASTVNEFLWLIAAAAMAMLSKYVLAIRKRHLFNPAAAGAFIVTLVSGGAMTAFWWVATPWLLPVVLVVGLTIVRKIRHFSLFATGVVASGLTILAVNGFDANLLPELFLSWPIIFFCSVMLTEPATTPPTKHLQIVYGALVGVLFGFPWHIGPLTATPELALLLGNIFSYLVSPKQHLVLRLKNRTQVARDTYHFSFEADHPLAFRPGQYLEWTLLHDKPDARGNRRYFTIASSSKEDLAIGVKITDTSSTFKKALLALKPGDPMTAGQLSGDFVLSADTAKPLVFIAGGIGITPFRSMIRDLIDRKEQRNIVLFYACKTKEDAAYIELFEREGASIGLKTVLLVDERLTSEGIKETVPDVDQRFYYLSGPNAMVTSYRSLLRDMGIRSSQIKTDYFPGL